MKSEVDIYREIAALRQRGGNAVLVTVIRVKGSTPRKPGAKMLVFPDGKISGTVGGGIRESDIISMARNLLESSSATALETVDFHEGLTGEAGPVCGGEMQVFMEKIGYHQKLIINGAGHVGHSLYQMAVPLGFQITIIDPRPQFNSEERFPLAKRFLREFSQGLDDIELTAADAVVLVGPGHVNDQEMLPSVLRSQAGYIGMIGSKRKRAEVFKLMTNEHGFGEDDLARIYCPIGLDIGSESPAEIAVSVIAEIVKHFKTKETNEE